MTIQHQTRRTCRTDNQLHSQEPEAMQMEQSAVNGEMMGMTVLSHLTCSVHIPRQEGRITLLETWLLSALTACPPGQSYSPLGRL